MKENQKKIIIAISILIIGIIIILMAFKLTQNKDINELVILKLI